MSLFNYAMDDVSKELAYRAHYGTSMVPDERAVQEQEQYYQHMQRIEQEFEQYVTPENREEIIGNLTEYRQVYVKKLHQYWGVRARCLSTMIAGPSGFNTKRAERANNAEDKKRKEFLEWDSAVLERLRSAFDPRRIARRPIKSDDEDAVEQLKARIAKLEKKQEDMKAINKICRAPKLTEEEKQAKLAEMGASTTTIYKMLHPAWGKPGFEAYELSNNLANIKRLQERVRDIEAEQARPDAEDYEGTILEDRVSVSEDHTLNRIQLYFRGKPSEPVIDMLKRRGFHWAPTLGVWQRQLNENARYAVSTMVQRQ